MRFVATIVFLACTFPTAANGQDPVNPRVRVDISAGLAAPAAPGGFRSGNKFGAEVVVGARYRLSPVLDLRVYGEAILFHSTPPYSLSGHRSSWQVDPLLAAFAGPRIALSPSPTHMYLQSSFGVVAPMGEISERPAPAIGIGVGIRYLRGFGEMTYTHAFNDYFGYGMAYASLRLGLSLGSR